MAAIALTDLVKKLGFKQHGELANKIRDLLKDKEDFKKFIIEEKSKTGRVDGRDEKVQVSADAEILVDNLAILAPYVKLFGVAANKEQYTPLQFLRTQKKRSDLKQRAIKFDTKIRKDIERSKEALYQLPQFVSALLNAGELDITKNSLRSLIEASAPGSLVDLSNSFESSLWNEIVELQDLIGSGNESSLSHQKLGENLFKMGEFDSAIEHLERAVELAPENGTAYAILALIYQALLEQAGKELNGAMAHNDYSGFIEHPIDAEEYWINERIEFGMSDYQQLREQFMINVIQGLYHWPEHDYKRQSKKNYLYSLKCSLKSELDTKRLDLMLPFLKHVRYSDFEKWPELISMIMELEHCSSHGYWLPISTNHNNQQKCQVMAVASWVSTEGAKQLLEYEIKFVDRCTTITYETYGLFSDQIFRTLYIKFFGRAEYERFIGDMLYKFQNEQLINNLEIIAQDRYLSVTGWLYKLEKHYEYKGYDGPRFSQFQQDYLLTEQQIRDCFAEMLDSIQDWQSLLDHKAWQQFGSTDIAPSNTCSLIVTACLIELSHNVNSEENLAILKEFLQTEHNLRKGIGEIGYHLSQQLVEKIKVNCTVSNKDGLSDFLNQYSATIEQIEEHREMEDMWG